MNRRTLLKSMVAAPAAVALRAQDSPVQLKIEASVGDSIADPVVRYFSQDQFAALSKLSEALMPSSPATPGAKEARAAEFLDFLLGQSPASRQTLYRAGLDHLNSESAKRYGKPFAALDARQSDAVLEPLHRAWTFEDSPDVFEQFLRAAKEDVMDATRNSYEWISAMSKRSRSASGIGMFWYPLY